MADRRLEIVSAFNAGDQWWPDVRMLGWNERGEQLREAGVEIDRLECGAGRRSG